jgi:membrane protein GlpM
VALLLKSLVGALAVLLIAAFSNSRNFFIAGLIPLFPTFALIAHIIVGSGRGSEALRTTALFGLCSLSPYAVYLLVVYLLCVRLPLGATLVCATLAWSLSAGGLILVWTRLSPGI